MRTLLTISLSSCLAVATLTGCGFRPLHEATSPTFNASLSPLSAIAIETNFSDDSDNERAAFYVAEALKDRIGTPGADQAYRLILSPRVVRGGLGVGTNDVASRYDLNMYTSYRLVSQDSGNIITKGRAYSVATYGAPRDPYGNIAAEISATEQAAKQSADKILTDLAVFFANENRKARDADSPVTP